MSTLGSMLVPDPQIIFLIDILHKAETLRSDPGRHFSVRLRSPALGTYNRNGYIQLHGGIGGHLRARQAYPSSWSRLTHSSHKQTWRAMCCANAGAIVVPRSRFAPVKTCSDLFVLRSDVYRIAEDATVEAVVSPIPLVKLDDAHYKLVDQMVRPGY